MAGNICIHNYKSLGTEVILNVSFIQLNLAVATLVNAMKLNCILVPKNPII